jgi:hypothetical protein
MIKPNQTLRKQGMPLQGWILFVVLLIPAGEVLSQTSQSPTQSVCPGTEPYLVSATPGSDYSWSITTGSPGTDWVITGSGSSISVNWLTPGVYTLAVVETNAQGCQGLPVSVTVTVNTGQVITITPAVNPVCFGTEGAVYTTEPGMSNYAWVVTGGIVTGGGTATDNTVTVNWNGSAPYRVSVNYTSTNGCTTGGPAILDVNVIPLPVTSPIFHN